MLLVPRYHRFPRLAVCLICFAAMATMILSGSRESWAQSEQSGTQAPHPLSGGKLSFEVASIRPAPPGARPHSGTLGLENSTAPPGGRVSVIAPLSFYIQFAYDLLLLGTQQSNATFKHLPGWVTTELFDLEAQAPTPDATPDQIRLMMQSLLADRFKLAAHFETHDVPVMALVLVNPGKLGPRIRPHSEGPPCDDKIPPLDRNSPKIPDVWIPVCNMTQLHDWTDNTVILGSRDTTMDIFTAYIPTLEQVDRPIVNQTGLTGRFDVEVNFTPYWVIQKAQNTGTPLEFSGPTFFEGLKNDLGMKLIPTHAPVQTLVIDHVKQPSPN